MARGCRRSHPTGGVAQACKRYLRPGGIYLTNDHRNDGAEALQDEELRLIAMLQVHGGKYRFVEIGADQPLLRNRPSGRSRRYLRQTSRGAEYVEHEQYFLFKRTRRRP